MSETMHTPGPWEYRENCIYPTSRQRCIARLDWHIRDDIDDANANLISAAPDMLAALILMDDADTLSEIDEALKAVRAAIVKATKP